MGRTFDGSTQYSEATSAAVAGVPVTFSCWIRPAAISRFQVAMCVSKNNGLVVGDLFRLMAYNTNVIECASFSGATPTVSTTSGTIVANAWQHIAATFSVAAGQYAWLNGVKSSSGGNSQTPAAPNTTTIGSEATNSLRFFYFQGSIADAAIWNDVLSDGELTRLANGESPQSIGRASRVGWWHRRRDEFGTTDRDFSGYARELTPSGSPTWSDDPPQTKQRRRRRVGVAAAAGNRRRRVIIGAGT